MKEYEIGDKIELKKPYRGYRYGEIIDYENFMYIVEFSSGMTASFYNDEFKED
jgi:hypothetical protein